MNRLRELGSRDVPTLKGVVTVIVAAIVLTILFTMCAGNASASPAPPANNSGPRKIDAQGNRVPYRADLAEEVNPLHGPYCWEWKRTWWVEEAYSPHPKMYQWRIEISWCTNLAQTKVTDKVYHFAMDAGGYYYYDSRDRDCGELGYEALGCNDVWQYHFAFPILSMIYTDYRNPQVRFDLHANGHITGTVYFDN